MARELAALEEAGYEGKELESKLRRRHASLHGRKGDLLLRVKLTAPGERAYMIFPRRIRDHLRAR